ncbi:LacI family DNA-binding transcriptional regulator [Brachybacterium sp. YJGR34]|uniref:LacI family DNA-binding transcriptional regulator n=1 Tax=Brachybacterium sp. YJGR34 TaxID=2059911 RepID=UPI000E0B1447|nr:LacI family DNA-binding transcriptional regulator [Brachybacterium sp. YJGR34]
MKRITLADVAAHAGVSRTAASLAVRGTGRLSEDTRRRIKASMDELGYTYHRGAASLRTQSTSLVGLVVTDLSNPFFAEMALGFEATLSEADMVTIISSTRDSAARFTRLGRALLEHPVEALVYVPVTGGPEDPFPGERTPALAATRDPGTEVPFLGVDDRLGGYVAARHLLEVHGRRRVVYLGGPEGAGVRGLRLEGVRRAVDETDGAELIVQVPGVTSVASGEAIVRRYLETGHDADAVICHSDLVAFAACRGLRERGARVPEDVSVVGFDGLDLGRVFDPPLTSVSADPAGIGRRCAQWVLASLRGEDVPVRTLVEPELIVRRSCGC